MPIETARRRRETCGHCGSRGSMQHLKSMELVSSSLVAVARYQLSIRQQNLPLCNRLLSAWRGGLSSMSQIAVLRT